jgi:hypothetical protein
MSVSYILDEEDFGRKRFTNIRALDYVSIQKCFDIAKTYPVVSIAIDNLQRELKSELINIKSEDKGVKIPADLNELIQSEWMVCVRENVKHVFCTGLAVFTYDRNCHFRFPQYPFTIYVGYDTRDDRKIFFARSHNKMQRGVCLNTSMSLKEIKSFQSKNMGVIGGMGYDPDINGTLNSKVYTLLSSISFMRNTEMLYAISCSTGMKPTMVIETPVDHTNDADLMTTTYAYTGNTSSHTAVERLRTPADARAAKMNLMALDSLQNGVVDKESMALHAAEGNDFVVLPGGHKLSRQLNYTAPPDFLAIKRETDQISAAMFGSSHSRIQGKDEKTVKGVVSVSENFDKACNDVKKMASLILTHMFDLYVMSTHTAEEDEENELYKMVVSKRTRVEISSLPKVDLEQLGRLMAMGVVSKKEYANHARTLSGLPLNELPPDWEKRMDNWLSTERCIERPAKRTKIDMEDE